MHILIESLSGFNKARKIGYSKEAIWYTSSPMVVEQLNAINYNVVWLDDLLDPGVYDGIGLACYDAVNILALSLTEMVHHMGLPESLYFLAMPLQQLFCSLMYRQAMFVSWLAKTETPRLVVGDPTMTPPKGCNLNVDRFDTLFAVLAANSSTEVLAMDLGDRTPLYKEIDKGLKTDRLFSLAQMPLSQMLFWVMHFLGRGKTFQFSKKGVLVRILHDNELIREMLHPLLLRGAGIRFERPMPSQQPEKLCPKGLPGESEIAVALGGAIRKHGFSWDLGPEFHSCSKTGLCFSLLATLLPCSRKTR